MSTSFIISAYRMEIIQASSSFLKRVVLCLVFCFLFTDTYSQGIAEYSISGIVREEGSRLPLKDVQVSIQGQNKRIVARALSDGEGKYLVKLANGNYAIVFHKDSFLLRRLKFVVNNQDLVIDEIYLKPESSVRGESAPRIKIRSGNTASVTESEAPEDTREVRGKVVAKTGKSNTPLAFCKIYISSNIAYGVKNTITLENGVFRFYAADGVYKILIETMGYKSKELEVNVEGKNVNLGSITLEIGEEIAASNIQSESFISRNGTRITYDVSKDPDASKISMTEMISRVPDLRMASRDGKLKYDNKDFSRVLINNTESGLVNKSRQYPMEFIKADYMKKFEVVLPGDAEYNNDLPILLISLAKDLPYGFASNLEMMATTKNRYSPSVDAVINTPLIGIGFGYDYDYAGAPSLTNRSVRELTDMSAGVCKVESSNSVWEKSNSHIISTNLFRNFADGNIRFNASLNTSYSNGTSYSETGTILTKTDNTVSEDITMAKGFSKAPFRLNGAMRLSGSFSTPIGIRGLRKNKWQIEYAYMNSRNEIGHEYPSYTQFSSSGMKEHRAIASFNFSDLMVKPIKSSFMFKGGFFSRYYDNISTSNLSIKGLDYIQNIVFLDISMLGSALGGRLGYVFSLRNEYLSNKGSYLNEAVYSPLEYDSFKKDPMANLSWRFKRSSLAFGYTKSVKRPDVNQLNPYEDKTNPYNVRTGNPNLKGERRDSYSLSYMIMPNFAIFSNVKIGVSYSKTTDKIARILNASADGIAVNSLFNVGQFESYGLNTMIMFKFGKSCNGSLLGSYSRNISILPSGLRNTYDTPSFSTMLNWYNNWFDLSTVVNLRPSLTSVQASKTILEPSGELSISKYFKRPHIGVSLSVTDIFHKGGMMQSTIVNTNFIQHNYAERLGRSYMFRLYWRFGKFKHVPAVNVNAYDM